MIRIFAGNTHPRAVPGRPAPLDQGNPIGLDNFWVVDTDPEKIHAKNPDAEMIARWLAEHVTSTSRYASRQHGLVVVAVDRLEPMWRGPTNPYDNRHFFRYVFGMLYPFDSPESFLVRHAYRLLDEHRSGTMGGVLFLTSGEAQLPFTALRSAEPRQEPSPGDAANSDRAGPHTGPQEEACSDRSN